MELRLDITKSLWENVQELHERLKKLKKKRERLIKLIEEEERKVREEREAKKVAELRKRRKREWYEAFRWMFTSGGRLVIGGRDARTNEVIVRKYLSEDDLFFHADIVGAPAVVLKDGKNATEGEINEAAVFAASYSRAWRLGLHSVPVFYVEASQVSLSPPSGEYRPRGGVIVRGKRNWLEAPLRLYLGFDGERFFVSAAKTEKTRFLLTPGGESRTDVAKKVIHELGLGSEYLDDLLSLLPPGPLNLEKVV